MTSRPRRTVACPKCAHPKDTGANTGVRLVCSSCGEAFRCPAPEPAAAVAAGAAPPDLGRPAAPAAPTNGVTVSHAAPVIPQVARPRGRGAERGNQDTTDTSTPVGEPTPEVPASAPVVTNPTGRTGPTEVHVAAGRRGGLAKYAKERMGR